jgi:hypothetical protein
MTVDVSPWEIFSYFGAIEAIALTTTGEILPSRIS